MSEPETTLFRCPSCGAPIAMGERRGTCSYCETVVERSASDPGGAPVVITRRTVAAPGHTGARRAARQTTSGCGIGIGVAALLGLLVAAGLTAAGVLPLVQFAQSLGIDVRLPAALRAERIFDVQQVIPRDAPRDDLLVILQNNETHTLGLLDGADQTLRWQTPPLSKDYREGAITTDGTRAYVADQTSLQAFGLSDGGALWQSELAIELVDYCPACLRVAGDRLLTIQKDGALVAFSAETGAPLWELELPAGTRDLTVVGETLVVPQAIDGEPGAQLALFDLASGNLIRRLRPTCAAAGENSPESYLSQHDSLLPLPDGAGLIAVLSWGSACVQRWSLDGAAADWEVRLDSELVPHDWARRTLLADAHLFVSSDAQLTAIDLATGALTELVRDEEHQLLPLFSDGATLVVKASPEWDSQRHSLWALRTEDGERRWRYDLTSSEWFGDSGFNEWGAQLTSAGVAVVEVPGDTHELIVERLDLATGASQGRTVERVPGSGTTVVWGNHWGDRAAWLLVDNELYAVDLLAGTVSRQRR